MKIATVRTTITMYKIHVYFLFLVVCLTTIFVLGNSAAVHDDVDSNAMLSRAVIDSSNMPIEMQVNAANLLNTAYEVATTLSQRMIVFQSLFTASYPQYSWNVVANYEHVYFIAFYNIRLSYQGDVVFMFSANATTILE